MPDIQPFECLAPYFEDFEHTAFRLETRRGYAVDIGTERYERFLRGEALPFEADNPWHANVRRQTALGKRFERVRVVDDPLTLGQRFLLTSGLGNVDAGEDIRNLPRAEADRLGLPTFDYWLFDSRTLARFHFDGDDNTLGVELITATAQVLAACQARDAAWHHAVPTREFTRVTSGV
ncbi:DUF6879 family protein [Kitasatospora sp. MBT63]|uniref:DUF6879 family protein n=1 Tax=Kitasatospora sp. MBT63 TaxID=1444768 RepID=UPI00068EA354|nr:DUF6879 family protein [Kitasatospora sp. MBT63]